MYLHVRPIFSRLPRAFSSMVVSPPAMLPLVGWLSMRLSVPCASITSSFDAEAGDRLAGLGDAVDHPLGPAILDADDDDGSHIGVGAGADQCTEVQIQIGAELQPPVGMRQRQGALDVVGHGLAGGIRQIVE